MDGLPTTHEFTTKRMLQLAFLIFMFGIIIGVSMVLVYDYTDWWQQLGFKFWSLSTANWWFIPALFFGSLFVIVIVRRL